MESVLTSFSLSFLMRSVFAGGFFWIAYICGNSGFHALEKVQGNQILSDALPVALFSGVTLYGLHRSLLYPLIEFLFDTDIVKCFRKRRACVSQNTRIAIVQRWDRGSNQNPLVERAKHMSTWADFAHLQYVSALALIGGSVVSGLVSPADREVSIPLVVLFFLLFTAGLVSDWRLRSIHEYLVQLEEQAQSASVHEI
jgi:hypothetical protein